MVKLFQPGIFLALLLALLSGVYIPLSYEKPRFFKKPVHEQKQTQGYADQARFVYNYKLAKSGSYRVKRDWFDQISDDELKEFLPESFTKFNYSSYGLLRVPKLFMKSVPLGLDNVTIGQKKAIFIRLMLPLILRSNEEIWKQRKNLEQAINYADYQLIKNIAKIYKINTDSLGIDELIIKVKKCLLPIPTSLALAQAAIESGWGTSRFSIQGNALFGQWSWSPKSGLKPLEASNSQAVVRSFPNIQSSVTAYMKNLNSHSAYQEFRELRNTHIKNGKWPDGLDLAPAMHPYAETGNHYVNSIRNIILQNNLERFDYSEFIH